MSEFREARRQPRRSVPAMYTLLRARLEGEPQYCWLGHIYDISLGGIRFELDTALEPGAKLEIRALLPGQDQLFFHATGTVVRIHEDDGFGPTRMALCFDQFRTPLDRQRLARFMDETAQPALQAA
ncbi:MAG: PilZ domain-containing protein [Phycisphaeraceae bacterium]